MTQAEPALVWCPFANEGDAAAAAHRLLDEGLVACANIMPPMRSLFIWEGARGDTVETGVLFKTNTDLLDQTVERLAELHPYDQPAIIGWRADRANMATRNWLGELPDNERQG